MSLLVDNIINAMEAQLLKYNLELLSRYPNDLLVIDRAMLERYATPGAQIAWMCGHSHTHLVVLGVHPKDQELVTALTNLARDDRFYVLSVLSENSFKLKEVSREAYGALATERIRYHRQGVWPDGVVCQADQRIGTFSIETRGTRAEGLSFQVQATVARPTDRVVMERWIYHELCQRIGWIGPQYEIQWA